MRMTGVGGIICAAHYSREGILHGHTYEVTAWFADGYDAIELQQALNDKLGLWDHTVLPPEMASGEALAEHIGTVMQAIEVTVSRPAERIYAKWIASPHAR